MSSPNEIWQIMIDGQVYEADTETIKQWAAEKRVLPTDKVKKGNLNWNDANRIPMLRAIFSGQQLPPSAEINSPLNSPSSPNASSQLGNNYQPKSNPGQQSANTFPNQYPSNLGSQYSAPANVAPVFNPASSVPVSGGVCRNHPQEYASYVCRVCSAMFCNACPKKMGTMAICIACGDMCNKIGEVVEKANIAVQSANFYGQAKDFGATELVKAFQYPLKFPTSLVTSIILYSILAFGSGFSWMITAMKVAFLFSCMSLTIRQVSAGRMDRNFLPDLTSFTFFDDIVKPVALSVGVSLVTFGPLLIVAIVFLKSMFAFDGGGREALQIMAATGIIVLILGGLSLLWALFYYPMAIAIAGFTQDFASTINPSTGIDTMRRMGSVYIKAFVMYLAIFAVGSGINFFLAIILTPVLAVPFFGGLIYDAISGGFTFYTSIVVACVLGTALYKCAEELDIAVDR
jgi:hypothetical protein